MVIPFSRELVQDRLPGMPEPFDHLPYAIRESESAQATIIDEIVTAKSLDRLEQLRREVQVQAVKWLAVESAILDREQRMVREQ